MVLGVARPGACRRAAACGAAVNLLLDTHFLLWIILGSERLAEFPWIDRYRPWTVSPVSLLEIQFLAEIGRLTVRNPGFANELMNDPRFTVDDAPLVTLVRHALGSSWTRDPFDRLLAAHSASRRIPLCTTDRRIRAHHSLVPLELRG